MNLAFVIFKYFPHGGLQLDFKRIMDECLSRGHRITVFCQSYEGEPPLGVDLRIIDTTKRTNHGKALDFSEQLQTIVKVEYFDCVVGFNRVAGLDVYFAGDNCFKTENGEKAGWKRVFSNRYKAYEDLEKQVFSPDNNTIIMYLVDKQKRDYIETYQTQEDRFRLLPPGIDKSRRAPEDLDQIIRIKEQVRNEFGIKSEEKLIIQVGSGFNTKGVDRLLLTYGKFNQEIKNKYRLLIVGRDSSNKYKRLAKKLYIDRRVIFAGGRDDVPNLLLGADLMIHLARKEATGTTLIEAIAAGLPVICTSNCGFSPIVEESGGVVINGEPYEQEVCSDLIADVLNSKTKLNEMKLQAVEYGKHADFYQRAMIATDIIEECVNNG